jgi:hypothetical protein
MRRMLPLALLAALALAGTATAALPQPPRVNGSVIGGVTPIRATATVTPPVQTFGNAVTATVTVLADAKWIDPARVRPVPNFFPYAAVGPAIEHESEHGRVIELTWSWTLNCLTASCVPVVPPSDLAHVFRLQPVVVHVLRANGRVAYSVSAPFPELEVLSEISPEIVAYLHKYSKIEWQYDIASPAPSYRVSPALVFWLALVLAGLCGVAGVALIARWALRFRTPYVPAVSGPSSSSLERALALFFWAGGRGDETLQRKALERVAAELPFDVADLSDATREIAWSPETPEEEEVEAISAKAGVLTRPQQETDE